MKKIGLSIIILKSFIEKYIIKNSMQKKYFILLFLILFILNCCKEKNLNIITDDISIFEIINKFNLKQKYFKANIQFIETKSALYEYIINNNRYNFDVIIGSVNHIVEIPYTRFTKLKEDLFSDEDNLKFNCFYDYLKENENRLVLYRINFPVVISKPDLIGNKKNFSEITIDELYSIFYQNKFYINRLYFFKFLPQLSNFNELDYLFLFNFSPIQHSNKRIEIDTNIAKTTFEFYNFFSQIFNLNPEEVNEYILRNKKIEKEFYFRSGILSLDFYSISEALGLQDDCKIYFLKEMNNLGLKNYAISIPKYSKNKNKALIFVKYVLSFEVQKFLYDTTNNDNFYKFKFLPIYKNIISIDPYFEIYIENLKSVNFLNNQLQKKIFSAYLKSKNVLNNTLSREKSLNLFLENFSNNLKALKNN